MSLEHSWNDFDRVNLRYSETNLSAPLFLSQILHGLPCNQKPASAPAMARKSDGNLQIIAYGGVT
jgi:hypothetical protein